MCRQFRFDEGDSWNSGAGEVSEHTVVELTPFDPCILVPTVSACDANVSTPTF